MNKPMFIHPSQFDGKQVSFSDEVYLNATQIAKQFGKQVKDYLRNERTQEYMTALTEYLSSGRNLLLEQNQLVITQNGSPENGGGTWLHPKLAIDFARWLNPKFAVWCDMQIEQLLGSKKISMQAEYNRLCMEEAVSKMKGSFHGLGLYQRKLEKATLHTKIAECEATLQLEFAEVETLTQA